MEDKEHYTPEEVVEIAKIYGDVRYAQKEFEIAIAISHRVSEKRKAFRNSIETYKSKVPENIQSGQREVRAMAELERILKLEEH